jgi:N-methylhydantoinase B
MLNGQPINPKRMLIVQPGDRLALNTPGGGGYGPVAERGADASAEDRRAGLVSDDGYPTDRENARFT